MYLEFVQFLQTSSNGSGTHHKEDKTTGWCVRVSVEYEVLTVTSRSVGRFYFFFVSSLTGKEMSMRRSEEHRVPNLESVYR